MPNDQSLPLSVAFCLASGFPQPSLIAIIPVVILS